MDKLAVNRVVSVGVGSQEQIDSQVIRRASATAARHLQQTGAHQIALAIQPEEFDLEESVRAEIEGALLGLYTFKKYKQSGVNGRGITSISLLAGTADRAALDQAREHGVVLAEATNLARDLVNEAPNVLTPSAMANRAGPMADHFGLAC